MCVSRKSIPWGGRVQPTLGRRREHGTGSHQYSTVAAVVLVPELAVVLVVVVLGLAVVLLVVVLELAVVLLVLVLVLVPGRVSE